MWAVFVGKGPQVRMKFIGVVSRKGGERLLNACVTNVPWGRKSPFPKLPCYQKCPSLEGVENLSLGGVCVGERAAPGRGRVEDEGCGLDSARAGVANISRVINVLVGRDQI